MLYFPLSSNNSSANAKISDRVKLHWKCIFTPRRPVVTRGDSFCRRVALKLVVTTLVWVKLVINLWRFVPTEKYYCKKRPVSLHAMGGYTRSLKFHLFQLTFQASNPHSSFFWRIRFNFRWPFCAFINYIYLLYLLTYLFTNYKCHALAIEMQQLQSTPLGCVHTTRGSGVARHREPRCHFLHKMQQQHTERPKSNGDIVHHPHGHICI